jgi:hypothetical protein
MTLQKALVCSEPPGDDLRHTMRFTWAMLLFAYCAGHSLWTGIWPNKPMKWYDRSIRITGGILKSEMLVLMALATRK